ncbi:hypothetical protein LCGC14_1053090 [marine sediment metagenome]|uniref:Uncharacterized protein n=1 Tax=marine sediment metagenome TaxID=412755 RepID=A0A0F9NA71_9ZZZZ
MSDPLEHLNKITEELVEMGKHGHLNDFKANTAASAVHYELTELRKILEELEKNETNLLK